MLDNAGRLRGIYHIDPEDKEFNETPEKCAKSQLEVHHCLCKAMQIAERPQRNHLLMALKDPQDKICVTTSGIREILSKDHTKKNKTNYAA